MYTTSCFPIYLSGDTLVPLPGVRPHQLFPHPQQNMVIFSYIYIYGLYVDTNVCASAVWSRGQHQMSPLEALSSPHLG